MRVLPGKFLDNTFCSLMLQQILFVLSLPCLVIGINSTLVLHLDTSSYIIST